MNKSKIVASWDHCGLECTVVNNSSPVYDYGLFKSNWFCGYVKVPVTHPLHGKHYDQLPEETHEVNGGVTYSESDETGTTFGFDCVHGFNEQNPFNEQRTIAETEQWAERIAKYKP